MALAFLRNNGPHTMGPLEDEGAVAAALIFFDLEKAGLVHRANFGNGNLQFSITEAGRQALSEKDPHP